MREKIELLKAIYRKDSTTNSWWRITLDLIKWLSRNRGKFYYYYGMGFHRKGHQMDNYLTHPEFKKVHREFDAKYYLPVLEDKHIFSHFVHGLKFPTPSVVALLEDREILWMGDTKVQPLESLTEYDMDVYCKLVHSWGGKNVFRLQVEGGRIMVNGRETSIPELNSLLSGGKYILQETVKQHPKVNEINPWCVNTVRVITITDGKTPGVLANVLRVGTDKNYVDNASSGNLQIGLNENDELWDRAARWNYPPSFFTHHPDTGFKFEGFKLPMMQEARQICTDLHRHLSYFFTIAWDVAISESGPVIIEGNPVPELMPMQMYTTGFRKMFFDFAERFKAFRNSTDPDRRIGNK